MRQLVTARLGVAAPTSFLHFQPAVLDALPAAVYACDPEGRITYFNAAAASLWGREPTLGRDQWCGAWRAYTVDGVPLPLDQCPMAVCVRERRSIRDWQLLVERPDGVRRRVLPFPDPLRDTDGQVIGATNLVLDITDLHDARERLDEAQQRLAAIVESSDDAIIGEDLRGIITSWNHAAERLFGYSAAEAIGRSIALVQPMAQRDEEPGILARITRGETVDHCETVRQRKDGSRIDVALTVSPIKDRQGRIVGASKIVRDISERVRNELTLSESRRQLRAEVAAMNRLYDLTTRLTRTTDTVAAMEQVLDSSLELLGAEKGLLQLCASDRTTLRVVAQRGLAREFLELFAEVKAGAPSACGRALLTGERVVVADVTDDPAFTECLPLLARSGIAAVQSTPLISRDGEPLGVLTTHFGRPHLPSERELRILDLYVRQAADVIERLDALERLRESERSFSLLAEQVPQFVWTAGRDGGVDYFNQRWYQFTGAVPGSSLGDAWTSFLHPSDREHAWGEWQRALQDCNAVEVEYRFRAADGHYEWFLARAEPLRDPDGSISRWFGTCTNINARRQAESALRESEQRFARFMGQLPGLAWIKDGEGRYIYANATAAQAFGTPIEELYGRVDSEIFPPAQASQFAHNDRLARLTPGGIQTVETLRHPDGSVRHSLVSKFQIPDERSGQTLIGGIAVDITDRIHVEAALREADRRKDEFIATLGHELRNPLTPLSLIAQLLNDGGLRGSEDAAIALTLRRQVDNLIRLVDDLLEISRISQGKIVLRRADVDLKSIIDNSVEIARPHIDQARHALRVELPSEPVPLHVDPTRVAQIIANLLNNAAKYTPDGGQIELLAQMEAGEVVVRVRDNGVGIPPEQLPDIFEMFKQGDGYSPNTQGGMGIGLSVARQLAELHGGRVTALSDGVGKGSELILALPGKCAHPGVKKTDRGNDIGRGKLQNSMRILVADDNRGAADIMAIAIRGMGADVRVAYDGNAAVETVRSFRPAMVFMDIGMTGVDGHEAARQIRADPINQDVVLIAVSGWGQDEMRQRSLDAGFNHHAVKPLGLEQLRELVRKYGARES